MNRSIAGAIVAVGLLLSGCKGGGEVTHSPTPTASSVSASPSPSVSSSPSSDEELAADAVVRFWAEIDRLSSDPAADLSDLAGVARGQTINTWQQILQGDRVRGLKQTGQAKVSSVVVKDADPEGRRPATVCIDLSSVNMVDSEGKSVVVADRSPRVGYDYLLERDPSGRWFVIGDTVTGTC